MCRDTSVSHATIHFKLVSDDRSKKNVYLFYCIYLFFYFFITLRIGRISSANIFPFFARFHHYHGRSKWTKRNKEKKLTYRWSPADIFFLSSFFYTYINIYLYIHTYISLFFFHFFLSSQGTEPRAPKWFNSTWRQAKMVYGST